MENKKWPAHKYTSIQLHIMKKEDKTLRIDYKTHKKLKLLSIKKDVSIKQLLNKIIKQYYGK